MAGLGAGFAGLLGNNVLQQLLLYNVAGQVIGAALAPYADALGQELYQLTPTHSLSPADAAEAQLRNVWDRDRAAHEARNSGVDDERYDVLAKLAGNAPAPQELAVALRRKLISAERYLLGIRQGRTRDEWAELYQELSVQQPSPVAMLQAYLEGQVDEATARAKYAELGGDPAYFDILFNSQGQAPSPLEAATMARRGIIPWGGEGPGVVSFRQAFLEGPWRNKWEAPFRVLADYIPPPRTISAMLGEGSIDRARAAQLLAWNGVPDDLIPAFLDSGSNVKTAATRDLAQSTVVTLYRDRLASKDTALGMLSSLGYDATEAGFLLAVADVQLTQRFLEGAVGRVHTLYVGHKASRPDAIAVLNRLGLEAGQVSDLMALWDLEEAVNVKLLTPTDLAAAYKKHLISLAQLLGELEGQGYTPHDAWVYAAIHSGADPDTLGPPPPDAGPALPA